MPNRIIGIVPILLGALILVLQIDTAVGVRPPYRWTDWVLGPASALVGVGLRLSLRLAWALAVLGGVTSVAFGVFGAVTAGSFGILVTAPYWLAGVAMLCALLSPPTTRWAFKRRVRAPDP